MIDDKLPPAVASSEQKCAQLLYGDPCGLAPEEHCVPGCDLPVCNLRHHRFQPPAVASSEQKCAHRFVDGVDGPGGRKGGTCGLPESDVVHQADVQDVRFVMLPGINLAHPFLPPAVASSEQK